ncbi:hypothetical protein CEF21_08505 [Bacillus sp. FJAT-42376]|nr:hypothetical protein CEF21_08505 [Bacillus sp. FJAT-42376]
MLKPSSKRGLFILALLTKPAAGVHRLPSQTKGRKNLHKALTKPLFLEGESSSGFSGRFTK